MRQQVTARNGFYEKGEQSRAEQSIAQTNIDFSKRLKCHSLFLYIFSIRRISLDEHVRGKTFPTQWLMQMLCNLFMKEKKRSEIILLKYEEWMENIKLFRISFWPHQQLFCHRRTTTVFIRLFVCLFDRCCSWCNFFFQAHCELKS